ncbi:MAG: hypothetical protein R3E58_17500 [Phycisphaerae bacterium]
MMLENFSSKPNSSFAGISRCVHSAHIGRLDLYRTSGHYPYYEESQFPGAFTKPIAGECCSVCEIYCDGPT